MQHLIAKLNQDYKISLVKGILLSCLIFSAALVLGLYIQKKREENYKEVIVNSIRPVHENNFNYKYIFPLLSYDFSQANQFLEDKPLEAKINAYVNGQYKSQNAQSISVYVRNFFDNHWLGVNQDIQYHPGSLLKVLIMMAYFRESELDPSTLNKTFLYSKATSNEVNSVQYSAPTGLVIGQGYTVEHLMELMIANSD